MVEEIGSILLLQLDHRGIELRGWFVEGQIRKFVVVPDTIFRTKHAPGMEIDIAIDAMLLQAKDQVIEAAHLQRIKMPGAVRICCIPDTDGPGISAVDEVEPNDVHAHARKTYRELVSRIGRRDAPILAWLLRRVHGRREDGIHHEIEPEKFGSLPCAIEIEVPVAPRV